jgi:hypothetical protein
MMSFEGVGSALRVLFVNFTFGIALPVILPLPAPQIGSGAGQLRSQAVTNCIHKRSAFMVLSIFRKG